MITGRNSPNVIGPSTPSDTNNRARTPIRACASAQTGGSGSIGVAARRSLYSVQAPTISQITRARTPRPRMVRRSASIVHRLDDDALDADSDRRATPETTMASGGSGVSADSGE